MNAPTLTNQKIMNNVKVFADKQTDAQTKTTCPRSIDEGGIINVSADCHK